MDLVLTQRYDRIRKIDFNDAKEIEGIISYSEAVSMFLDIASIINNKQLDGETPISVPLKNIRVNDSGIFTAKFDQLFELKDNIAYVDQPYVKIDGDAPEVLSEDSLPARFNQSVAYFSLCSSILKAMQLKDINEIDGTKLFYAFQRILNREPSDRFVLFI